MKKHWLYVFIWLTILFILSSDFFSYYATRALIRDSILFVDPEMPMRTILKINASLRKILHVINYAILSWLFLCAWVKTFQPIAKWNTKVGLLSFLCCILFSISDEWRQSWSAIRTPTLFDIVLDASGALLTQLICMSTVGWKQRKNNSFKALPF